MKTYTKFLIFGVSLVILGPTMLLLTSADKRNATYEIVSGNNKIYYANTFRMIGKGIMFDDIDGKKIILTGDIDIEYIKKQ